MTKDTQKTEAQNMYEAIFDDQAKIKAFDLIAENYFYQNFGTMQKADLDVLLFSVYIEQILKKSEEDMSAYSDYRLSKLLGITQNRIASLKEKKELKYPFEGFDVKTSFERILKNANYENGKIRIYIPDRNLFLELKHIIEQNGGIVDVQLNTTLLQVTPDAFINLLIALSEGVEQEEIKKKLKGIIVQNGKKCEETVKYIEAKSFGENLKEGFKERGAEFIIMLLEELIGISSITNVAKAAIKLFDRG